MYQAIEAISRAGVIEPIEPVQFEENEPLVILRLSKKDRKSNGLSGSMMGFREVWLTPGAAVNRRVWAGMGRD